MSTASDLRRGFDDELRDLVEPLRRRLHDVDEWIETHNAQLSDLRDLRREIVGALKPLVPDDSIPYEPGRMKPGPPKGTKIQAQNRRQLAEYEKKLDELLGWLRETYNGSTFTGSGIARETDRWGHQSQVSKHLVRLHERQQIAVDGMAGSKKLYRVV